MPTQTAPGALQWTQLAQQYSQQTGVPAEIFLAAIQAESGGNPLASGDGGHSIGLFQLHDRGAGYGLSVTQRQDPLVQFQVMASRFQATYREALSRGFSGVNLAIETIANAERPAGYNVPGSAARNRYSQTYNQVLSALGGGLSTVAGGVGAAAPFLGSAAAGALSVTGLKASKDGGFDPAQIVWRGLFIGVGLLFILLGLLLIIWEPAAKTAQVAAPLVKAVAMAAA